MTEIEQSLEKWQEKDLFLRDVKGAEKFVEDKVEELKMKVHVTLSAQISSRGYHGYEIWLEVPHDTIQPQDPQPDPEYERMEKQFIYYRERIPLKKGATEVLRDKDGKWYYSGDFDHIPKEDIMQNVALLYKIMQTVGKEVKGAFAISKCYDKCLHMATLKPTKQELPTVSIYHGDYTQFRKSHSYHAFRPLEENIEELTEEWIALQMLAGRILLHQLLTGYDPEEEMWRGRIESDYPVLSVWRETPPKVEDYLKKERQLWDPFNDPDIGRNGGVEYCIHPFMRRVCYLTWDKDTVVWYPAAEEARDIYYKQYDYEELAGFDVKQLRFICFAKGLNSQGRKEELIDQIHKACWSLEEKKNG